MDPATETPSAAGIEQPVELPSSSPADPGASPSSPGAAAPVHATAELIAEWEHIYDTKRRTLFKWLALGRRHADPCPLHDPAQMPQWWSRRMKHTLPAKLQLAAAAAHAKTKVSEVENPNSKKERADTAAETENAAPPQQPAPSEMGEGEAVRQAKQIVASCFAKWQAALNADDLDKASLYQVRWEKSVEALRKQEKDDRESRKQMGELLPKGQIITEAAQMIEALRLAHGSMGPKIIAELSRRADGRKRRVLTLIEPSLLGAIESVRSREAELFENMETLTSPDAAREAFTLQAE